MVIIVLCFRYEEVSETRFATWILSVCMSQYHDIVLSSALHVTECYTRLNRVCNQCLSSTQHFNKITNNLPRVIKKINNNLSITNFSKIKKAEPVIDY